MKGCWIKLQFSIINKTSKPMQFSGLIHQILSIHRAARENSPTTEVLFHSGSCYHKLSNNNAKMNAHYPSSSNRLVGTFFSNG